MNKANNSAISLGDQSSRPAFIHVVTTVMLLFGLVAMSWPLIVHMKPAADAPYILKTVDISGLAEGQEMVVKAGRWPFIIRHRTEAEVKRAQNADISRLDYPETDTSRLQPNARGLINPKIIVVSGTYHLYAGFPLRRVDKGEFAEEVAWHCPLTGSKFDDSGRLLTPGYGNLFVPNYRFRSGGILEFMAGWR